MQKADIPILYEIALCAFQPDAKKYGAYPPLLKTKQKTFLPPVTFGKVFLVDDIIIGGAFVFGLKEKGEIGAIFLDPKQQNKGFGKQMMLIIEEHYPKVKRWRLETPEGSNNLHRFYESLGYVKAGIRADKKSGINAIIYEKTK